MANEQVDAVVRQSLDLSLADIKKLHPDWPKRAQDDYFYKQSNINDIARLSDGQTDQVAINTAAIASLEAQVAINVEDIDDNTIAIGDNTTDIGNNAIAIGDNTTDIGTNTTDIGTNTTDIGTNTTAIGTNATNLTNHEALTTAHGVTGDNVGTLDFATVGTGGVVNLAAEVVDAVASTVSVTSPDATDLPSVITLANETKGDVNQLVTDLNAVVTQLNALLANMRTANQLTP